MFIFNMDDNKKLGTIILGVSVSFYILGILLLLDKALLMLSNLLFFIGLYFLVGFYESIMFFGRKIKGTIGIIIGLVFIITGVKLIGILFQVYGVYEFFKSFANRFFVSMENWPIIGEYIKKITNASATFTKKTDAQNQV